MHPLQYRAIVSAALAEDLCLGDTTTDSIFRNEKATAVIKTREDGVICGLAVAEEVFSQVDNRVDFSNHFRDGDKIKAGDSLVRLEGPVASILKGERTALNFLQRMCGIATTTRSAVGKVRGTKARIIDTRKTTPGLRILEKYAVRMGGGENHRFNLGDMALIKDNHITGAGSIRQAVFKVRQNAGFAVKIEVEAVTLEDVLESLECGVDVIMLDNMSIPLMVEAVGLVGGRALVEASGGIREDKLKEIAGCGVDLISLGYLTHGYRSLDLSLTLG